MPFPPLNNPVSPISASHILMMAGGHWSVWANRSPQTKENWLSHLQKASTVNSSSGRGGGLPPVALNAGTGTPSCWQVRAGSHSGGCSSSVVVRRLPLHAHPPLLPAIFLSPFSKCSLCLGWSGHNTDSFPVAASCHSVLASFLTVVRRGQRLSLVTGKTLRVSSDQTQRHMWDGQSLTLPVLRVQSKHPTACPSANSSSYLSVISTLI